MSIRTKSTSIVIQITTLFFLTALHSLLSAQVSVSAETMRRDTRVLSHDSLMGRDTGSPGLESAARYVAARCGELGLEPAGDDYFQPVPMSRLTVGSTSLTVETPSGTRTFSDEAIPNFVTAQNPTRFEGRLVFFDPGQGRVIPPGSLSGTVVLVPTVLRSIETIDSLAALGVRGIIAGIPDPATYALYRDSRGPTRLVLDDTTVSSAFAGAVTSVIANRPAVDAMIGALRTPPGNATVRFSYEPTREPVVSHNVACRYRGTGEARGAIAMSAHLDHLGVGEADETGDSIFNGFSDNAAGVAMLLAIAERLPDVSPRHDILFFFFTGEERGLLGSEYVAAHPVANDSILGLINLDAGAPPAPPARWEVVAGDDSPLGATARHVAERNGWGFRSSAARPNSDFFPFHRVGIPSIFIIPGRRPYEGMTEATSDSLFNKWDAYHSRSDEWAEDFPWNGVVRYADYALETLIEVDGG